MKKSKRKAPAKKPAGSAAGPVQAGTKKRKLSRREILGFAKFAAVGVVVLGGGGYYVAAKVAQNAAESDFTKLGNGQPTVVQIHDPQCPTCNALQSAARTALGDIGDSNLQYLVARLDTPDGRAFAQRYGVGRVTILLFDGQGRMRQAIQGPQTPGVLEQAFRAHAVSGGS